VAPFAIIGTDGGLVEKPQTVSELLLVPGERYDILAGPFSEGEVIAIEALRYNRTTFLKPKTQQFAQVRVTKARPSIAVIPAELRTIEVLSSQDAPVTREVKLSVGPSMKRGIDFLVNNEMHNSDRPVHVGELQVWEVSNTSLMDHPFHLHGFFFQVLEVNGKPSTYNAWKDTVNLSPRSKVKIAWMPDNRPGMWMYHCHILEHHGAGMMAHFELLAPGTQPSHSTATHAHAHHEHT
jgi:FtsP/CotA-like multicopper oxidase with cupredoxin domain